MEKSLKKGEGGFVGVALAFVKEMDFFCDTHIISPHFHCIFRVDLV